ncbi:OprD family porin [Ectopseudomonas mendocina]|nr:OprD family porin [Pseudomonas mendocina]
MNTVSNRHVVAGAAAFTLSLLACSVQAAGFIEDSHASLRLNNYYFDRDYKGESNISARREWAQGFTLKFTSGFTEGPVGFGLDAQGMLGVKLDSSGDRIGTGLLPTSRSTGKAQDEYGELGLTGKLRYSKTELHAGTVSPFLPVLFSSPARLLLQTFRGAQLNSKEVDGLTLHAGWLDRMNLRDSTDYQPFTVAAPNGRFNPAAESDRFVFLGGDYQATPALTLRYYYGELDDIYQQHFAGLIHEADLGPGKFRTDIRYFHSDEDGSGKAGTVDNRNVGAYFSYGLGAHRLGAGYMHLSGKTAMPYITGSEPLVHSEGALSSEFINPNERTWQVRYDYDFAGVGVPGLKGMVRYLKGSDIELSPALGGKGLSESSRDLELSYTVQSGSFKGVSLRVRNAHYRNDFAPTAAFRDGNETRINIDYTLALW